MLKKVFSLMIVLAMISAFMIGCGNESAVEEAKTAEAN